MWGLATQQHLQLQARGMAQCINMEMHYESREGAAKWVQRGDFRTWLRKGRKVCIAEESYKYDGGV